MANDQYIANLFRVIVERTSAKVLPYLQTINPDITGVHYQHGHPVEIAETLLQMDQDPDSRYSRLPLIALFQDIEEQNGDTPGIMSVVRPKIAIVTGSRIEAKAHQRYQETFLPILYPVYLEFIKQVSDSVFFLLKGGQVIHKKTDRLYWGSKYVARNGETNQMNDILDGIELLLDLKVYENICKKRLQ